MNFNEEKFIFGSTTTLMMIGAWLLTNPFPSLATSLSTLIGGMTAMFAIFSGASVTNKWVDGKSGKSEEEDLQADARALAQGKDDSK